MKLRPAARAYLLARMDARLADEEAALQHLVAERHRIYNDYRRALHEGDARLLAAGIQVTLPPGVTVEFDVEIVSSSGVRLLYQDLVDFWAKEMERSPLGRTLTMGDGSSYDVGRAQQDHFRRLVEAMRPHHGFRKLPAPPPETP